MIDSGSGGKVMITKGPTDELDSPFSVAAWAAATDYKRDQTVATASTNGSDKKYWVAKNDHTSEAADKTNETATVAGTLAAAHWDAVEMGELTDLIDWQETRPTETEDGATLLRETRPRTSSSPGAVSLALNLYYNYDSLTARVLGDLRDDRVERVYVTLMPDGKGTGREKREGYFVMGEWSSGGNQADLSQVSVTLASDGDWTSSAQA